jgi:hypothetical protein
MQAYLALMWLHALAIASRAYSVALLAITSPRWLAYYFVVDYAVYVRAKRAQI